MPKVNLGEKCGLFDDHWPPRILGEINHSFVKLAKFKGEFVGHQHKDEDELLLVVQGELLIRLRNKQILLKEGAFFSGVEHLPIAHREAWVLLHEPTSTRNTGSATGEPGRRSNESDSPDLVHLEPLPQPLHLRFGHQSRYPLPMPGHFLD
jgi:mannose-6-phosphate isomerase-like protein (cupin superfamily)